MNFGNSCRSLMVPDLTAHVAPLLNWRVFLRRFEKLFIGENDEIALVAMDIPRGLFVGLDYFVGTRGKCAGLVRNQGQR